MMRHFRRWIFTVVWCQQLKESRFSLPNLRTFWPGRTRRKWVFGRISFSKKGHTSSLQAMSLLDSCTCEQGIRTVWEGIEGLCLLLGRLPYPCRYRDLIHRFDRTVPEVCMMTNHVMETIYSLHHHRLTAWNHTLMSPPLLQTYADDAIRKKGSALPNCFIDGTVRPICRPQENQRIVYNWHKKVHG